MESDDLTVVGRLLQTLEAAILKAMKAVTVLVLVKWTSHQSAYQPIIV